jgi:hypothetical protein
MKILPVGLIAAAFSLTLLLPATRARAQDWQDEDMQGDAYAIHRDHQELRHDSRELRDDLCAEAIMALRLMSKPRWHNGATTWSAGSRI